MAWRRKWFWKSKAKKKKEDDGEDEPISNKKRDKNTVTFQLLAKDKFGTNTKYTAAISLLKKIPGYRLGIFIFYHFYHFFFFFFFWDLEYLLFFFGVIINSEFIA